MAGSGGASAAATPEWGLILVQLVATVLLAGLVALTLACQYLVTVREIGTALWGTHGRLYVTSAQPLENGDGEPGIHGVTLTGDFTSDSGDEHATGVAVGVSADDEHDVGDTLQVWLWTPVTDSAYQHPGVLYPLLQGPPLSGLLVLPPFLMWWVTRKAWAEYTAEAEPATDGTP